MRGAFIDLRHAFRQLRRAPGFAAVCILSLALGIGATVTVFSVIYGALLNPYPYRGADRMVQVRLLGSSGRSNFLLLSARQFEEFQKLDVLDGAVAMDNWDKASTGDALPEAVRTAQLSSDAFPYFGMPPLIGRTFAALARFDEEPARVAVLSHPYWQRRYGGRADAIGKTLQLDRQDYVIIGVMPPRFRWGNSDAYIPLPMTADPNRVYIVDARLKDGVSYPRAEAVMQPLLENFARETPGHFLPGFRVRVRGLTGAAAGTFSGTLFLLFGAVAVLLAIGCANVSILFLARGTGRLHEFAVRAALGANRARLIGQLFTESLSLALAGGTAGVLFAIAGVKAVAAWLPAGRFPPEAVIRLNAPVLAFSTLLAVATGILFGVSPALRFSAPQINRLAARAQSRRTHRFLVASQVALTILLLAAAGGAVRSFMALYHTKLGYDPRQVLAVSLALPDGNYTKYETRAAFYHAIHQRVAVLPGVKSATVALFPVPPEEAIRQTVEIKGRAPEKGQTVDVQETTGDYFPTLGIPLLRGRAWSAAESQRAAHVAVINQEMARRFWPAADPIGQSIRLPEFKPFTAWILAAPDSSDWLEIIGVAGDTPNRGLREPVAPAAYVPYTLLMGDSMNLVIRTEAAPLNMVRAVRERIHSVDAGQPVGKVQTAEDLLRAAGWAREQFVASLFLVFALLALALAVTGLYSVVSYATALRSREFGIRVALGAQKGQVVGLVLASALKTVGVGVAAGLAITLTCNTLAAHWFNGGMHDPVMLAGSAVLLLAAGALAAFIPAGRAAARDPMQTLRAE